MPAKDYDYEIEYYERFFGDPENVLSLLENCPKCNEAMFFSYQFDPKTMFTKETGTCPKCSFGQQKKLYNIC